LGLVHTRQIPRFLTGAAITRLTADLGLAPAGQDWELEAADARRVGEFLDRYDAGGLDDDARFALMSLIVASFDELVATGGDKALQDRIVEHLSEGFDVLNSLVQYWALPDATDEEAAQGGFGFTPVARQVMRSKYGGRESWPRTPFAVMRAERLLSEQGVYDSLEIADNRDGTFGLWWSRIAGRESGGREFASIEEAVEFARWQFGIGAEAWREIG
jgi:hypothetical protein